jgi:RNA polymerase sigma-70 factor, ECF subfamily
MHLRGGMSTASCTDILAMMEVRDGNTLLFDDLVQRHRRDLVGYLYRMVNNHSAAEELAQEVFLRAYRARAGYKPSAKFTTWLYSIGIRLALNWLRDNRHRRYEPLDGDAAERQPRQLADRAPLPDTLLIQSETARQVRTALAELPDRQRTAVVMHKYHDMTYGEIGGVLKCSPQAVKAMLFRAHSSLRQRLAPSVESTASARSMAA